MAIAVDASSPARVTTAATAATTAAFNPPACLLVVCTSATGGSQINPTIAITSNGTALTWVEIGRSTPITTGTSGTMDGCAAIHAAVLTAGRTGMTVTATQTSGSSPTSIKLYCLTGTNVAGTFYANSTLGFSTVNQINTTAFTSTSAASLFMMSATDWSASGVPTSADTTADGYTQSTALSGMSGYRAIASIASQTCDLNGAGVDPVEWMYVTAEILPPAPRPIGRAVKTSQAINRAATY
jgi:hypothetical protein